MHRLFAVAKIPVFCDSYAPGVEKRRGEEVAILVMRLRVQPFDAKLATALDEGVGGDSNVRSTVFAHTTEPKPHFTRHDFKLDLDARQLLTLFASSDTEESRIAIDQVKLLSSYVRVAKDVNALALCFKVSFGPVSRDELEYIHAWVRGQRCVTFTPTENALDFEEDESDDDEDDDDSGGEEQPTLPDSGFSDPPDDRSPMETSDPKKRGRVTEH